MNLRILSMTGLMLVGLVAFDGTANDPLDITTSAVAVCTEDPVTDDPCSNPCQDTSNVVYKITKREPWQCPQ